jgi:hypothetical protein
MNLPIDNISSRVARIAFWILISLVLHPTAAWTSPSCALDEAFGRLGFFDLESSAKEANKMKPILERLEALGSNAKNPYLPLGAQLADQELKEYNLLSKKLLYFRLFSLIRSDLVRDSHVLIGVEGIFEKEINGKEIAHTNENLQYLALKQLITTTIPEPTLETLTTDDECSVVAGFTPAN